MGGINDWQAGFEKAGFKNDIVGKEWPENDSTMSLEDARFSVIRYFASDIENDYGPNIADPRSGEILESHIGWYHNVMKLVHDWYMLQTAAVDSRARKMKFDDALMGDLIRFVSSHEVGHTLGLRHNMGSSSQTPVEKLRDKAWVEANGHTASIMDYARFNYVAQPEDHIGIRGLYPRIGDYDKWAIQWGYMGHVAKNVGGIYETFKSVEQMGDVYEPTPKAIQKEAVDFLNKQLFITPAWLLNKDILNKFSNPAATELVGTVQTNTLNSLLSGNRLFRMAICTGRFGAGVYGADELLSDLKKGVWNELTTAGAIEIFRRNLQKTYIDALVALINPSTAGPVVPAGLPRGFAVLFGGNIRNTDIPSIARAQLVDLRAEITAAIPRTTDKLSRYHLQDLQERIREALNPKP